MSLFQLCKGVECLRVNEFGLPRDKGSFRKGSKVCDRCEDAADRAAGIRPVRVPVAAPAAPAPAVEAKAPALDRVPCKRCGLPFPPEELNKDGGCKPCKRQSNRRSRERRVALRKQKAGQAAAPEVVNPVNRPTPQEQAKDLAAVDYGKPVAPLPPPASQPLPDEGSAAPVWAYDQVQMLREFREMEARLGRAQHALQSYKTSERDLLGKILALEHALTASRVMYEALEERFRRHVPEAHQR